MSTELMPVKGRIEIPDGKKRISTYKEMEILITSFSGGVKIGKMIQLTFPLGICHVQLTKDQVRDLISTLSEWID